MFIKFADTKLLNVFELPEVEERFPRLKRRIASIEALKLEPNRYIYLRNRSISSLENWGPNYNWDAFPRKELKERHLTFVGSRVSIDHQDDLKVGIVLDSIFVPPEYDEKGKIINGDFVENILSIDKRKAEELRPGIVDKMMDGTITGTSMGTIVEESVCSACHNVAENEDSYCIHIPTYKGKEVKLSSGEEKLVFEICYGVTFFEDSIIIPRGVDLPSLAGGEPADQNARLLQRIASCEEHIDEKELEERIFDLEKSLFSSISSSNWEKFKTFLSLVSS